MTAEDAIAILNARLYEGHGWYGTTIDDRPVVAVAGGPRWRLRWFTLFEAIAVAEALLKAEAKFPRLKEVIPCPSSEPPAS